MACRFEPGRAAQGRERGAGINKSAITSLVDRMEAAGLVRRQPSKDDGRAVHLHATRSGLFKVAAARPILSNLNGGSRRVSTNGRSRR
jgi:DNA-binding MarR family transcriptional regulator